MWGWYLFFIWYFLKKFLRSTSSPQTARLKCLKTHVPTLYKNYMQDITTRIWQTDTEVKCQKKENRNQPFVQVMRKRNLKIVEAVLFIPVKLLQQKLWQHQPLLFKIVPKPISIPNNSPPGSQQPEMINSIKATPLQPGQPIPPGTTAFMYEGKTFCIPKASMPLAQQQYVRGRVIGQAQIMTAKLINPNGKQFLTFLDNAKSDTNGENLKSDSKDKRAGSSFLSLDSENKTQYI